jgi:hypothetical protein
MFEGGVVLMIVSMGLGALWLISGNRAFGTLGAALFVLAIFMMILSGR